MTRRQAFGRDGRGVLVRASPKPSCFAGRRGTPARLTTLASELVGLEAHEPARMCHELTFDL